MKPVEKILKLADIEVEAGTQPRISLNGNIIRDYAEDMKAGANFPSVDVVSDGKSYWLVDGFHRLNARREAGFDHIKAAVVKGTLEDAVWASLTANRTHGVRRSNADKAEAVKRALKARPELSDPLIAEHVGVSPNMVLKYREEMESRSQIAKVTGRTGKDGKSYPVKPKPEPTPEPDEPEEPTTIEVRTGTEPKPDGPVDKLGNELPDVQSIRDAFGDELVKGWMMDLRGMLAAVELARRNDNPAIATLHMASFKASIDSATNSLKAEVPYAVCPMCKANPTTMPDCKLCVGRGWVGKFRYNATPEEMK